jgi:hypothetical protein
MLKPMKRIIYKDIYIPKPCHENWNKMKAHEKEKFCLHCSRKVYDFTKKSEEELNQILLLNKGNVCGSFYEDQINQSLVYRSGRVGAINLNFKKIIASVLTFLGLNSMTYGNAGYSFPKPAVDSVQEINGVKKRLPFISGFLSRGYMNAPQNMDVITDPTSIKIYLDDKFVAKIKSLNGEFQYSFDRELSESAKIKIILHSHGHKNRRYKTKYFKKEIETTLDKAQNMRIVIDSKKKRRLTSVFIKRRRVAGKFRN